MHQDLSLNSVPAVLSQKHLTILVLSHLKLELTHDYPGAMLRYQMSRDVAEIILSFTSEDIQLLASTSDRSNVLRVANPTSKAYWQDLKMALVHRDTTAIHLQLIQGLLAGAPAV